MNQVQRWFFFVALTAGTASLGGCKVNAAATEKCKDQKSTSDECSACCKTNGASGHEFVTGSLCKCLG